MTYLLAGLAMPNILAMGRLALIFTAGPSERMC
jgi:hypothetical protein